MKGLCQASSGDTASTGRPMGPTTTELLVCVRQVVLQGRSPDYTLKQKRETGQAVTLIARKLLGPSSLLCTSQEATSDGAGTRVPELLAPRVGEPGSGFGLTHRLLWAMWGVNQCIGELSLSNKLNVFQQTGKVVLDWALVALSGLGVECPTRGMKAPGQTHVLAHLSPHL